MILQFVNTFFKSRLISIDVATVNVGLNEIGTYRLACCKHYHHLHSVVSVMYFLMWCFCRCCFRLLCCIVCCLYTASTQVATNGSSVIGSSPSSRGAKDADFQLLKIQLLKNINPMILLLFASVITIEYMYLKQSRRKVSQKSIFSEKPHHFVIYTSFELLLFSDLLQGIIATCEYFELFSDY